MMFPVLIAGFMAVIVQVHCTGKEQNRTSWTRMEDCKRECDGSPRTCYLKLTIERYTIFGPACRKCEKGKMEDCYRPQCVTADGHHRSAISANRQIPGPPIQVCQNDTLVVDVRNQIPDETTSIHWHGIRQTTSQWADGVPFVTQCPIQPANTFRYAFIAEDPGTYFYHSHTGTQKLDGLSGALIIRGIKKDDKFSNLYDEDEHVMMLQDWTHIPAENIFPGLHTTRVSQNPATYLINGKGAHHDASRNISLPIEEFVVKANKRYRFRLVGSTCTTCAVSVTFEGHNVTAISADGDLKFEPVTIHTVVLNSADRFDVILHANQPAGIYYIRVEGFGDKTCNASQYALLRYEGINTIAIGSPNSKSNHLGRILNDVTSGCEGKSEEICMTMLKGISNAPTVENQTNYFQFELDLGFFFPSIDLLFEKDKYISYDEPKKGLLVKAFINNVTFSFPPSPLLSQSNDIPPDSLCSGECPQGMCSCVYYQNVSRYSVVDLIIVHKDNFAAHPFHLHGHNFYVLYLGKNSSDAAVEDLKHRLRSNLIDTSSRVMRDTVTAPLGGVAAVRFIADNIGYWIFHCHFNYHLDAGMAGVLKVGEVEHLSDLIPTGFPKCGNFIPNLDDNLLYYHTQ